MRTPSRRKTHRDIRTEINFEREHRTDTQKAICSVAYLLEWTAKSDDQPIDGTVADGLASLLRKCAVATGRMFTIVDLRAAGGDPKELEDGRVRP